MKLDPAPLLRTPNLLPNSSFLCNWVWLLRPTPY